MTLGHSEYYMWYKDYPMFSQWAMDKQIMFLPPECAEDASEAYDLTSKAYILMKRLGQDYAQIMRMDSQERDALFDMEMKLIKEEQKQSEK